MHFCLAGCSSSGFAWSGAPTHCRDASHACSCTILGAPGELAQDFTDALLAFGALAAWITEAVPDEQPLHLDPEPGMGPGALWLKEVWRNCKVVALFPASQDGQARCCSLRAVCCWA